MKRNRIRTLLLTILFSSVPVAPLSAMDKTLNPHPHPAILKPIQETPKRIALRDTELQKLEEGKTVLRQTKSKSAGAGVAIQLVSASPKNIWDTILNYERYPDWVNNVDSCKVYKKEKGQLYVEMKSSVLWFDSAIFTINTIRKDQGYMSWVLDRKRTSDVKDMVGYWRIETIQVDPPLSRLEYSTELVISGVPDFLVSYLTEDSLTDGTAWVKREAEKREKKKRNLSKR